MYAHIFPRAAHDPIVNKSLRLDNWPGKLTTLWHAFVHGRLSKPAPPRYDCHIRLFNELDEDCQGKTETSEEKIDRLSALSSSSTLPVVASGEFHACSSPILPKGEVPKNVLQVMKPVLTVAANFQKKLEESAKRTKGNAAEVDALVRKIHQYSHLLVFLLSESKGTSAGISAFEVALYDNLGVPLKDFAVISEALIKGLKMAVDLGEWSNRNGIRAQLNFAQMEWDFIEGVMKEILAEARTDLILKGLASRRVM
ncbi:hypothetical protein ARMSODRAFT_978545 [Armillaria solidipes]|uniref:Uncharacterized protein n=1 Tax=Armillaria solidipes TaxID=1076256 RepID=A0A2H3BDN1_9AGAR|nr:hypothetical protein ARMSODRAFT_978545 [Armillaria solidipes]